MWLFIFGVLIAWGGGEAFAEKRLVLLSPAHDEYFFSFLEVFLRRSLPDYRITTIITGEGIPQVEGAVVVGFPEDLKVLERSRKKPLAIVLGEDGDLSIPVLGRVVFAFEEVARVLQKELFSGGKGEFLFVGEERSPFLPLLGLLGEARFFGEVEEERVVVVERAFQARPFLRVKNERPFAFLVLEAATEMLFALQEGKVDVLVDTKPSAVASCIVGILRRWEEEGKRSGCCTVSPLLVTRETIASADAYEVVRRCLSCH
ncbi:hypothetical protein ACP6EK_03855 [Candidatus Caldatribacterium sp. SIUC1]|uniref:hypothetical protein n=1 Tax=Candidatus Caldatribacterium sp. SIUC1 TaxID=3418365 RepID=UPI003F693A29